MHAPSTLQASFVLEPTGASLTAASTVLKPTSAGLEPTNAVLKLTGGTLEPAIAVLGPKSAALDATRALLERNTQFGSNMRCSNAHRLCSWSKTFVVALACAALESTDVDLMQHAMF